MDEARTVARSPVTACLTLVPGGNVSFFTDGCMEGSGNISDGEENRKRSGEKRPLNAEISGTYAKRTLARDCNAQWLDPVFLLGRVVQICARGRGGVFAWPLGDEVETDGGLLFWLEVAPVQNHLAGTRFVVVDRA